MNVIAGGMPCMKRETSKISFDLSVKKNSLEAILGAAYLLSDRAFIYLDGDQKKNIRVTLQSKTPISSEEFLPFSEMFLNELETQKVRWAIAKHNLPIREYVARQAIVLANGGTIREEPVAEKGDDLSPDQRQEIEKLISEVEEEIRLMNDKKNPADPQNIRISWEEKNQKPKKKEKKA